MKRFVVIFLSVLPLISCDKIDPSAEDKAKFLADSGAIITGKFVPPKSPDKLTFIMLHGLASSKEEWFVFADKLAGKGYGYFAFDLRGHGESTKDKNGNEISYKTFFDIGPDSEWRKMVKDLDYAVKYLKHKGIAKERIGLIGASLGANVIFVYAAKNKFVPVTVLLSPGVKYAGIASGEAAHNYGIRPIAIAASPKDQYAYESSGYLFETAARQNKNAAFFEGKNAQHGVQMFDSIFENKIIGWIDKIKK